MQLQTLSEYDAVRNVHDVVNHPQHYTQYPLECIEITEQLSFCLGNAVKYCWRHDAKNAAAEDLRKAAWYIRREAERLRKTNLLSRMWAWYKVARLRSRHEQDMPHLVNSLLADVVAGDFTLAASYLEGVAVTMEN